MTTKKVVLPLSFAVICYLLFSFALNEYFAKPNSRIASTTSLKWNVSPIVLTAIAGEFKGLLAIFITLETSAYLGTEVVVTAEGEHQQIPKNIDWDYVIRLFSLSMELDPAFEQTYTLSQGFLTWEARKVDEQNDFLTMASKKRTWDWRPLHMKAFNTYFFLNKQGESGKIYLEAAKKLNAPYFLSILGARLAHKGGETEAAIVLMKAMLAEKMENEPGFDRVKDRLQALEGVLFLENIVSKYKGIYGEYPKKLEELLFVSLLNDLPVNPYDVAYCIDSVGNIYFDNPQCQ